MKCTFVVPASIVILTAVLAAAPSLARAEPGLLLVAHGSPSPQWNQPVLDFGRKVAEEMKKSGQFKAVRTAMLESTEPTIPTAVAELEAEGCDRIVAVPLFVAPTGHTHFDVPAMLGIYASGRTAAVLAKEGARPARPAVPVTLTQTLSEGDVLLEYAADQVRKLSISPKKEAIVVLAHGDPEHQLLADRLMRRIVTRCCGEAGIEFGDWAYIGVGQEYLTEGVGAIKAALEHKKRVLVVGVYISTSALRVHRRCVGVSPTGVRRSDPFKDSEVVFSEKPIIGHPQLLSWVVRTAAAALDPVPAGKSPTALRTHAPQVFAEAE